MLGDDRLSITASWNPTIPFHEMTIFLHNGVVIACQEAAFPPSSTQREGFYVLAFLDMHDLKMHSLHNSCVVVFYSYRRKPLLESLISVPNEIPSKCIN